MRSILSVAATLCLAAVAAATQVYDQPHDGSATLYQSSWFAPEDSDWDIHCWDDFTLDADRAITEVRWRGGYIYNGQYSPAVQYFTVAIYPSSIAGEPDIINGPLVEYDTPGDAGETPAGTFGGKPMFDYAYTLPAAFQAEAGVKYWVYILAAQASIPEWAVAKGTGGNGAHFRWLRGAHMYQSISGDLAFELVGSDLPAYTISASASPAEAGTVQGAGQYPDGSGATLVASPHVGWGFLRWTEDGVTVHGSASYSFIVTTDRTLTAEFAPAYVIATAPLPAYGGTTSGDGVYNAGSLVTVVATPSPGYGFDSWTELGSPVSTSATYAFAAGANRALTANFESLPGSMTFTFDDAPVHTSLPLDVTTNGVTAHLTASGQGFSIQPADALGFTPAGFSGLCVYPNSVFAADLIVELSHPLSYLSILYSPQELGCDDSATMRLTAFSNGAPVGTSTTTIADPGTWPTGTLAIAVPAGFDEVRVHYDAPPPTCQDWGPIFLADVMTVTLADVPCAADVDGSGAVNVDDLVAVIIAWGACPGPGGCPADIDDSGTVNVDDLVAVIVAWGACPSSAAR